jgi:hypothetical protein
MSRPTLGCRVAVAALMPAAGSRELDGEPARGNAWVLVIYDASRSSGTPGRAR